MRKAVFFDIDGTLWNRHCQIQPSTVEAINKLREAGHLAFICSGRSRANIRNQELLNLGFDGVIASCGTHIDFHKEVVFEVLLREEQIAHLLAVAKNHNMPVVLEGPKYIYVNDGDFSDDPYVIYLRRELGEDVKVIPENPAEIFINKFSAETHGIDLEKLAKDLGEDFNMVVHTGDRVFEVIPTGYSKATGIEKVCELFDIALEDTYAFGDSANDLEMLQFVAHGVAMGDGDQEVKDIADYITTGVEDDGIANGLKYYGLI
ncbi:MAG: Cof-type HAD-IIB family hydrolase [Lachnospiraceae bacterium]|nr:Cof-type HAD-IIB family hydrolase [Lachnospiraceae bacterium]